jgi:hypothetical protein
VALHRQSVAAEFLRLELREAVPDHSWLSKIRSRLLLEIHHAVFAWLLARLAERAWSTVSGIGNN